jgi:hypothetical protein
VEHEAKSDAVCRFMHGIRKAEGCRGGPGAAESFVFQPIKVRVCIYTSGSLASGSTLSICQC